MLVNIGFFFKISEEIGKAWRGVRVLRTRSARASHVFSLVADLLFDCFRVLEHAKIRTVLQSRLILANESWNGNCGYHFQLNAKSFNKRVKFWGNFAVLTEDLRGLRSSFSLSCIKPNLCISLPHRRNTKNNKLLCMTKHTVLQKLF